MSWTKKMVKKNLVKKNKGQQKLGNTKFWFKKNFGQTNFGKKNKNKKKSQIFLKFFFGTPDMTPTNSYKRQIDQICLLLWFFWRWENFYEEQEEKKKGITVSYTGMVEIEDCVPHDISSLHQSIIVGSLVNSILAISSTFMLATDV